jgi:hypothetical protein
VRESTLVTAAATSASPLPLKNDPASPAGMDEDDVDFTENPDRPFRSSACD